MNGVWTPSLRTALFCTLVILALLVFAAARVTSSDGVINGDGDGAINGENANRTVAVIAKPDTPTFAVFSPGKQEVEMRDDPAAPESELGTWLLMIFGFGAVAFALRRRRADRVRYQFS